MAEQVNIVESLDRISSLPDEVLRHILSLLPTKIGFSTCILSTRWRYLFPFSNNLDFGESLVFNQERYDENPDSLTDAFLDFVDRCVMLMNETNVDKFHFMCFHPVNASRVNSWIRAAPLHNVNSLDLHIWSSEFRMKRLCVFSCSTLVVLKLGANFSLKVPSSVDLPCLKILHLYSIKFLDDISTQRLFSGCPVIEDLVITGCSMGRLRLLNFSSPSLKRLTIDDYDTWTCSYKLVLDAPSLVYLKCYIRVEEDYMLKNLYSLSEAHISIGEPYYLDRKVLAVREFLEGISRVQLLSLSGDCVEYLEKTLDELPLLKNVTSLTFTAESNLKLSVLMKLLQCTPNLKEFIFYGHYYTGLYEDGCVDVPCCVPSLLRVIYNREFYYDDDGVTIQKDVEALAYFLKNAIALEKMWLYISPIHYKQKVFRRLRTIRETIKKLGGSEKCEIEFPRVCKH